jgi:hypothetical protein
MSDELLFGTEDEVAQKLGGDLSAVTIVLGAANTVRKISEDGGWDQPPMLATLDRLGVEVGEHGGIAALMATTLELPHWAFRSGAQVAATLNLLAKILSDRQGEFAAELGERDVFGFLYLTESWRLTGDAAEQFQAQDRITSMRNWPGRREVRQAMVVDRAGYRYDVTHFRDTDEVEVVVDRKGTEMRGRIIEGLAAMAAALPMPS